MPISSPPPGTGSTKSRKLNRQMSRSKLPSVGGLSLESPTRAKSMNSPPAKSQSDRKVAPKLGELRRDLSLSGSRAALVFGEMLSSPKASSPQSQGRTPKARTQSSLIGNSLAFSFSSGAPPPKTPAKAKTPTVPEAKKKVLRRAATMSKIENRDFRREVLGSESNPDLGGTARQLNMGGGPKTIAPRPPAGPPPSQADGGDDEAGEPPAKMGEIDVGRLSRTVSTTSESKIVSERVDALEMMHHGTQFLKYGTFGYPHFRHFHLSHDNSAIQWYSKNKKAKDTCIFFRDINEIVMGQQTSKFKRHAAPELARSSFSIIYGRRKKSLDLIAIQPREFKIWITGLRELIRLANTQGADKLPGIQNLYMTVKTTSKLPSTPASPNNSSETPFPLMRRGSMQGDKKIFRAVKKQYEKLRSRLSKCESALSQSKFRASTQYTTMTKIVESVSKYMHHLNELFANGDYQSCDVDTWRAQVALESLEHMMAAAVV